MASLIEGYNYDIFISYRQKDNKYDSWVTEFVENLRKELEATFKEEISVYFDFNPNDGLRETDDVDESLKEKLKCLIFIPIISRTYCDPNSFAWEHEFKAFVKLASNDKFGLKVRLANGNVSSRVLPVRIHDLDEADVNECEHVLDGVLRGIEFIYKEPGVNKPLTREDDENKNLNKTRYRVQINKVANTIKEIITAISQYDQEPEPKISTEPRKETGKFRNNKMTKILVGAIVILVLAVSGFILIPKLNNAEEKDQKSIAVLPFLNLSNDPEQEYFSDGMVDAILDNLFKVGDLKVKSRTSSLRYKNTDLTLKEIARELNVKSVLEGSVQKAGGNIRVTVQLIDAETDTHLWSDSFDGELTDVFAFQSDVAQAVAKELKIALTIQEVNNLKGIAPTLNPVAYDFYLRGNDYWSRFNNILALDMYSSAIEEDSLFSMAYAKRALMHFYSYWDRGADWAEHKTDGLKDLQRALELNPDLFEVQLVDAIKKYWIDRDYSESLRMLGDLRKTAPNMADIYFWSAALYRRQGKISNCIRDQEQAIDMDPFNALYIQNLAQSFDLLHQYDKVIEWSERGLTYVPDHKQFKTIIFDATINTSGDVNQAFDRSGLTSDDRKYDLFYYTRQYDKLVSVIKEQHNYTGSQSAYEPPVYRLARAYFLADNQLLCKQFADSSISVLKGLIEEFPDEDRYFSTLGRSYALAGQFEEAVAFGLKALEMKPLSMDAFQNPSREEDMMELYILIREYDKAMDKIEYLLSIPSWLSRGRLIADPLFDRLRNLSRFKNIIDSE